ncbi:MAG: acetate kinase [Bacteroidetes bacterium]|nr:MAG: acetate kinase [Bacteroidota bacterium]
MKILVINSGSSSIKYQLFNMETSEVLAKGLVDKIGLNGSYLKNERLDGDKVKLEGNIYDHQNGIEYVLGVLISDKHGSLKSLDDIDAVGHRVVHGGEAFNDSVMITDEMISKMEELIELAPLHNPPNLKGIYAVTGLMPNIPQVGVFDTAFHQTMDPHSFMYAIPYSLYTKYGIRRYGFHGTSHRYVSNRVAELMNKDIKDLKIISCHLGNGASIAAIKHGKSVDTSMGLTPVEGLMMGTRTGDLDVGALTFIMSKEVIGIDATNTLLNKHSGVLGVSGVSSDMREVEDAAKAGNERALLALDMYQYRVKKYIGSYTAAMGGVDVIIFTGGIGENAVEIRENIVSNFEYLGLEFDNSKNKGVRAVEKELTKDSSKVKVWIVPTDEELVIARDTYEIVKAM